ncbi:hypothetical protein MTR_7g075730 [Medicago truncatula]|uniref:Uncharacterized protein n=1 Tax=Medicago truncatula TaxID=3880 RepID=G7L1E1_MEDTR|nr:hypothetical protein MTR_7g075730 [Medicago truncatula]
MTSSEASSSEASHQKQQSPEAKVHQEMQDIRVRGWCPNPRLDLRAQRALTKVFTFTSL